MKKLIIPILILIGISIFFYVKYEKEKDQERSNIREKEKIVNIEKGKILAEEFYQKGLKKLEYNDIRGASNDFWRATEQNPKLTKAWAMKADSEYQIREYQDAVKSYTQTIYLSTENDKVKSKYYYWRGKAAIALNWIDTGCSDFSKAVELDRNNVWALMDISEYCN